MILSVELNNELNTGTGNLDLYLNSDDTFCRIRYLFIIGHGCGIFFVKLRVGSTGNLSNED